MNDLVQSISKWFTEKTSSSMYFTYAVFLVTWNWSFFQIIFLEDSSLFYYPRIEYIYSNLFFDIPLLLHTPYWFHISATFIVNTIWHIIPPGIFTFFAIKYLPTINQKVLRIELGNRFDRKKDFVIARSKYEEWELDEERDREKRLIELSNIKDSQGKILSDIKNTEWPDLVGSGSNLSGEQIQAILSLLSSFGAKKKVIKSVDDSLHGR